MDDVAYNIKFRLYQPEIQQLEEYMDPIVPKPVETEKLVKTMIKDSKRQVKTQEITQLAPRRTDVDLKRIMQPDVDELLAETGEILLKIANKKA